MITVCVHDLLISKASPATPAASPQPIIPQELIDIIIDNLYNDTGSLRACALVSSSWSGRSQQNLFSRITLAGRPWPDEPKGRTLAEVFLRLIESAPHLSKFVQHLEIIEGDAFRSDRWLARLLWRRISGIHTSFLSASKLPDLHQVTISSISSVPSLDRLFTLFKGSNVADICLVNVTTGALTDTSQTYIPGSVRIPLETLSLSLDSNEVWRLSSWLADSSCVLHLTGLRKLRITIVDLQEMKAASRLLEILHMPSLEAIEIQLEALDSTDTVNLPENLPDISRFRHVRLTLTPECLGYESEGWISASLAALCWAQMMENLRENAIETVTLTLPKTHPDKFPESDRMHWIALDAALTRADMSHLRGVYLEDESSQGMDYRLTVIKDILPNLYDKGLLVF
ncbi:hypothetical protein DFS33DRAFT_525981 [Desarmillaria ectypa]|nr:hypothetical protein DFS33DRAFT_525981 [Desarmillaria ectypa]